MPIIYLKYGTFLVFMLYCSCHTSCLLYSTNCNSLPFTLTRSEGFVIYIYIWIAMRVSYKKQELTILRGQMSSPWGHFFMSYYVSIRSEFRVMQSVMISAYTTMFCSSLPPVVCMRDHVLFTLFVFAVVYWCPAHIVLYVCFVLLRLVYSMLSVSLDCPCLKTLSVFSYVYYPCIHFYICLTLYSRR
jgi:hypothetical protein